jgi:dienelactone hydrolase
MPGITPNVAGFARRVADAGLTAVMPHLFGDDGRTVTVGTPCPHWPGPASPGSSRCWPPDGPARSSPGCGPWLGTSTSAAAGPGVGAVGMCFTGGFALAMMVDDVVVAPVLSQPSLPFPVTKARRRDVGLSSQDVARVQERASGRCVRARAPVHRRQVQPPGALRASPRAAGRRLHRRRDRLLARQSSRAPKGAHSVLTEDLDDRPGTPDPGRSRPGPRVLHGRLRPTVKVD